MAAGNFSASALQRLKIKLSDMFAEPNVSMTEFNNTVNAAQSILSQQTGQADERLKNGPCIGVTAYFPRIGDTTKTTVPTDCTIPTGVESEMIGADYDSAVLAHASGLAKDHRCDNEVNFADESALVIKKIMHDNRVKLLRSVLLPQLVAQAQVNLDPDIPSTWDDTTLSPVITIPKAEMIWESLGDVQAMVGMNNFGEYYALSGRNFYKDAWKSQLLTDNDDCCKAAKAAYGELNMFFDFRNVDSFLTYPGTFLIDKNSHLFWNTVFSTSTPTMTGDTSGETWTWYEADPLLSYNLNGRLVPVLHEIEMKKVCIERTSLSQRRYSYTYWARIIGGFESVPTGVGGEKGVLLLKAV